MFNILRKQMDESTQCPLCRASMYWVDAEKLDEQEFNFYQCSHCHHQIFPEQQYNCHCENCQAARK